MAEDIIFYDMALNFLYILPPYSKENSNGYISMNVKKEYNGNGSLELLYFDNELEKIIENNEANIIISWNGFQGFVTGFQNTETEYKLYGMHLNGLLHRAVIPSLPETTASVEDMARNAIEKNIDWLTLAEKTGLGQSTTYETTAYTHADEYIQKLLDTANGGYEIVADVVEKIFIFKLLKPTPTSVMLSENNLNAYNFEMTYNNKTVACGGWYLQKQEDGEGEWIYLSLDNTKSGIDRVDTVLTATTRAEAQAELKEYKTEHSIKADTKDIFYGVDYTLGSIIRLQTKDVTRKKLVKAVSMWQENSYGEEPELTEYNEEEIADE